MTTKREHISYSELKDWAHCPHYHKKAWVEKVAPFEGNEYTAFGTAIHDVCEKKLLKENIDEAEDTMTILSKYVQSMEIDQKKELDSLMKSLYTESLTVETV